MSAYDMDVSDAIYGKEDDKRYVCESRLKKMLSREYQLLEERFARKKHPTKTFFRLQIQLLQQNIIIKHLVMVGWELNFKRRPEKSQAK